MIALSQLIPRSSFLPINLWYSSTILSSWPSACGLSLRLRPRHRFQSITKMHFNVSDTLNLRKLPKISVGKNSIDLRSTRANLLAFSGWPLNKYLQPYLDSRTFHQVHTSTSISACELISCFFQNANDRYNLLLDTLYISSEYTTSLLTFLRKKRY